MQRLRVGFVSLGCPKNLVDTENMISSLSQKGFVVTGSEHEADVVVINTCGFLEPAKMESMSTIQEFVEKKKSGGLRAVVVAGCMTERYLKPMQETYPEVDAFIRTGQFSSIVPVVEELESEQKIDSRWRLVGDETPQLSGHSEMTDYVHRIAVGRPYAYVKISEGCNRTCSFCIIPKLRGKHHSRHIDGILDEVKQLTNLGTKEILLIAQDLTSYGRDLRDGTNLLKLVERLEDVDGLHWYRLLYNYPRFFDDALISHLASSKKFSGYLDIPFQHISDPVLRRMRRPESSSEIRQLVAKLRDKLPRLSLRTTLMVGFPGETDEDFQTLLDFIEETKFEHLGAFTFYREAGTHSFDLEDQVPEEVKQVRFDELMRLQAEIQKKILKSKLGESTELMIDGLAEKTNKGLVFRARHWGQAPEIDGLTYVHTREELSPGDLVEAKLVRVLGNYDLAAELV